MVLNQANERVRGTASAPHIPKLLPLWVFTLTMCRISRYAIFKCTWLTTISRSSLSSNQPISCTRARTAKTCVNESTLSRKGYEMALRVGGVVLLHRRHRNESIRRKCPWRWARCLSSSIPATNATSVLTRVQFFPPKNHSRLSSSMLNYRRPIWKWHSIMHFS